MKLKIKNMKKVKHVVNSLGKLEDAYIIQKDYDDSKALLYLPPTTESCNCFMMCILNSDGNWEDQYPDAYVNGNEYLDE